MSVMARKTGVSRFAVMTAARAETDCALFQLPRGIRGLDRPAQGVAVNDLFGGALRLAMAPEVTGHGARDLIDNVFGYLIGSAQLRAVIESSCSANIEYLDIQLFDHKGRLREGHWTVFNLLDKHDCVDLARVEAEPNPLYPGQLCFVRRLWIDEAAVPVDVDLLRPSACPHLILVSWRLREVIAARTSGVRFVEQGELLEV